MNQGIEKWITYISLLYFLLYSLNWIYLIKISHCHAWVCLGYCVSRFLSVITLTTFVKRINLPFLICQNLHSDKYIRLRLFCGFVCLSGWNITHNAWTLRHSSHQIWHTGASWLSTEPDWFSRSKVKVKVMRSQNRSNSEYKQSPSLLTGNVHDKQ